MKRILFQLALVLLLAQLLACGGGGGSEAVPPENQAPSANAGSDQSVNEETTITLSGSGSDTDGTISTYAWTQTSGTIVTLDTPGAASTTFSAPTTFTPITLVFQLTVTDNGNKTGTDSISIVVNPVNLSPTANAGADRTVDEETAVNLIGTGSDADGAISSYTWTQTSGLNVVLSGSITSIASFTTPSVTQNETLVFTLSVTDNEGATATDSITIIVTDVPQVMTARLNDTGITRCGDYAWGSSYNQSNNEDCTLSTGSDGDPIPAGQDGHYGRDFSANDNSDGHAGFSFTKLDANGNPLPADASSWSCIVDTVTGYIWENKTGVGGLFDPDNTYSWYNPDPATNGDWEGVTDGGVCTDSACDTASFVAAVNASGLCGANDWMLPTRQQLRSIVNYGVALPGPAIDSTYFPNTGIFYWTATPSVDFELEARSVNFENGGDDFANKGSAFHVRLIRVVP